ncbi:MAG: hypothetical protein WD072_11730 [Pirellulales bacterium]
MHRRSLRGGLIVSLASVVLLPIALAVTLGAGGLLAAVGDQTAAAVCRWVGLTLGILWVVSVVATAAGSAAVTLAAQTRPRHKPQRWRRRQRLRRRGMLHSETDRGLPDQP